MRREGVQLYAEIVSNTPERYLNGVVIYGTPDAVCDELCPIRPKFFAASNFESDRTVNGSLSPVRNRRDMRWLSGDSATTSMPDRLNSP